MQGVRWGGEQDSRRLRGQGLLGLLDADKVTVGPAEYRVPDTLHVLLH